MRGPSGNHDPFVRINRFFQESDHRSPTGRFQIKIQRIILNRLIRRVHQTGAGIDPYNLTFKLIFMGIQILDGTNGNVLRNYQAQFRMLINRSECLKPVPVLFHIIRMGHR